LATQALALVSKLSELRKSEAFCDITLEANDGVSLKAHRAVLALCPYLEAMLSGVWREQEPVRITNYSSQQVEAVLQYLYASKFPSSTEEALDLLGITHEWLLPHFQGMLECKLVAELPLTEANLAHDFSVRSIRAKKREKSKRGGF